MNGKVCRMKKNFGEEQNVFLIIVVCVVFWSVVKKFFGVSEVDFVVYVGFVYEVVFMNFKFMFKDFEVVVYVDDKLIEVVNVYEEWVVNLCDFVFVNVIKLIVDKVVEKGVDFVLVFVFQVDVIEEQVCEYVVVLESCFIDVDIVIDIDEDEGDDNLVDLDGDISFIVVSYGYGIFVFVVF